MTFLVPKSPPSVDTPSSTSVDNVEELLAEWFGAHVVLVSSGRAAILLALQGLGFTRYRSRVAVPRMIARCVLDAIIRSAFPVDAEERTRTDAALVFHQYGFIQTARPQGMIIEDIAHAFFASPESGAREWDKKGVAIFSLPKFFATTSMIGGIIAVDGSLAGKLRELRDANPARSASAIAEESRVFQNDSQDGSVALELMYISRLLNPYIRDEELGGLPKTISDIKNIGRKRQSILDELINAAKPLVPIGWHDMIRSRLPYALPISGPQEVLENFHCAFRKIGVASDMYQIDVNRNILRPHYEPMLLVPYSHLVPASVLKEMVAILHSQR